MMDILVETIIQNFLVAVDSRHGKRIQHKQNDGDAQDKVFDDTNDNEQGNCEMLCIRAIPCYVVFCFMRFFLESNCAEYLLCRGFFTIFGDSA